MFHWKTGNRYQGIYGYDTLDEFEGGHSEQAGLLYLFSGFTSA